jgi:hypothetical protein
MIVGVLTTCHTQYTWDRNICIFLFNRTLEVFVTYLTGALYVHPLWSYKHQHDNRVRSQPFVACQNTIVKVKLSRHRPEQAQRAQSFILSWHRHKKGVGGQYHAPAVLPPGKTRYPLCRRLGGSQGRSGRVRKISLPPGFFFFRPRTVEPVASRYTDWATRPPQNTII